MILSWKKLEPSVEMIWLSRLISPSANHHIYKFIAFLVL